MRRPSTPARGLSPDKLERVLLNLLTNALRATPRDGAIAVRVEPERGTGQVRVAVEDTGTGLTIARGLVEAHGGTMWAEERPGGGARVVFALPAAA